MISYSQPSSQPERSPARRNTVRLAIIGASVIQTRCRRGFREGDERHGYCRCRSAAWSDGRAECPDLRAANYHVYRRQEQEAEFLALFSTFDTQNTKLCPPRLSPLWKYARTTTAHLTLVVTISVRHRIFPVQLSVLLPSCLSVGIGRWAAIGAAFTVVFRASQSITHSGAHLLSSVRPVFARRFRRSAIAAA